MGAKRYGLRGRQCYCMRCGRKFGAVSSFDRHRVRFECRDPKEVGMRLNKYGLWVQEFAEGVAYFARSRRRNTRV
jgi:hypothetical protein